MMMDNISERELKDTEICIRQVLTRRGVVDKNVFTTPGGSNEDFWALKSMTSDVINVTYGMVKPFICLVQTQMMLDHIPMTLNAWRYAHHELEKLELGKKFKVADIQRHKRSVSEEYVPSSVIPRRNLTQDYNLLPAAQTLAVSLINEAEQFSGTDEERSLLIVKLDEQINFFKYFHFWNNDLLNKKVYLALKLLYQCKDVLLMAKVQALQEKVSSLPVTPLDDVSSTPKTTMEQINDVILQLMKLQGSALPVTEAVKAQLEVFTVRLASVRCKKGSEEKEWLQHAKQILKSVKKRFINHKEVEAAIGEK